MPSAAELKRRYEAARAERERQEREAREREEQELEAALRQEEEEARRAAEARRLEEERKAEELRKEEERRRLAEEMELEEARRLAEELREMKVAKAKDWMDEDAEIAEKRLTETAARRLFKAELMIKEAESSMTPAERSCVDAGEKGTAEACWHCTKKGEQCRRPTLG